MHVYEFERVMAGEIIKYVKFCESEEEPIEEVTIEVVSEILDSWFERDSRRDDLFDHLVPEEEFDEFAKRVYDVYNDS